MQTGKAYSQDLRERVIAVYQEEKSTMKEVAKRFAVSRSWVNNLVQRQKQTGSVAAKPHGGGAVAKVTATHYPILEEIIDGQNDLTLLEISQRFGEKTGVKVSQSTICRALQEIELTRKKKLFMLISKKVRQSNS
jgi:transposase